MERSLLHRPHQGDEAALSAVIDRYAGYVSAILSRILGADTPQADIEELAADTFFALWRNAGAVEDGKLKAYLGAVARNKAKDALRRQKRELPLEEDLLPLSPEDPARQLEEKELARFPREAVLSMGEAEREIFLRYYYAYEPIAEIAEALGIPLSTVKIRLRRGRQKLKEILQKGGYACEDQDL